MAPKQLPLVQTSGTAPEARGPGRKIGLVIDAADPDAAGSEVDTVVKYGAVTVRAGQPSEAEVLANIEQGNRALRRLVSALDKPGVHIRARKGIPLYHADPDHPGYLIRELDGRQDRGRFEGEVFRIG